MTTKVLKGTFWGDEKMYTVVAINGVCIYQNLPNCTFKIGKLHYMYIIDQHNLRKFNGKKRKISQNANYIVL